MKKLIIVILGYAILIGALVIALKGKSAMENSWKTAAANVKAYDKLLSSSNEKNAAYQLTVDQLNYAKDSVLEELNNTRKKLEVKDRDVKSVQYITSTFEKTDTIVLKDTLLKELPVAVDTFLREDWYQAHIKLVADTLVFSPSFKSEKSIVVSTKKETVNPPKKFWLFRLFQKKHRALHVDVIEKNPYAVNNESRYVEVIK